MVRPPAHVIVRPFSRLLTSLMLALLVGGLSGAASPAQAQQRPPYTFDQLARLVESGLFTEARMLALVRTSCLGFDFDERAEQRLTALGASAAFVEALGDVCTRLPQRVASLRLAPADLELAPDEGRALAVEALTPADTPAVSISPTWSSEDTTVARVDGSGRVLARRPGVTRVVARWTEGEDTLLATARVRVTAPAIADAGAGARPTNASEADEAGGADGADGAVTGGRGGLAVLLPGGAQFSNGETVKGAVVLTGVVGALAAGYFLRSTDRVQSHETVEPDCAANACTFETRTVTEVRRTRRVAQGAALAAAIWLGGLAEGLLGDRGASEARRAEGPSRGADRGLRLEPLPRDGLAMDEDGAVRATLARLRW